jgi:hypothetical protein
MEQSQTWEANSRSDGQEIFRLIWKPNFLYRSQVSANEPYSEKDEYNPHPYAVFLPYPF